MASMQSRNAHIDSDAWASKSIEKENQDKDIFATRQASLKMTRYSRVQSEKAKRKEANYPIGLADMNFLSK
jgi:hypothetical protein